MLALFKVSEQLKDRSNTYVGTFVEGEIAIDGDQIRIENIAKSECKQEPGGDVRTFVHFKDSTVIEWKNVSGYIVLQSNALQKPKRIEGQNITSIETLDG